MKKIFGLVLSLVLLAGAAVPTLAQGSRGRYSERAAQQRRYEEQRRHDNSRRVYDERYDRRYENEDDRSFWEKHRDKLTVAGGTAAGAAIGAAVGGKKGAIIGALAGAGGSALYTYKMRDRDEDRRRY